MILYEDLGELLREAGIRMDGLYKNCSNGDYHRHCYDSCIQYDTISFSRDGPEIGPDFLVVKMLHSEKDRDKIYKHAFIELLKYLVNQEDTFKELIAKLTFPYRTQEIIITE